MKKIYLLCTALSNSLAIQALAIESNASEGQTQSSDSLEKNAASQSTDESVKDLTDQLTAPLNPQTRGMLFNNDNPNDPDRINNITFDTKMRVLETFGQCDKILKRIELYGPQIWGLVNSLQDQQDHFYQQFTTLTNNFKRDVESEQSSIFNTYTERGDDLNRKTLKRLIDMQNKCKQFEQDYAKLMGRINDKKRLLFDNDGQVVKVPQSKSQDKIDTIESPAAPNTSDQPLIETKDHYTLEKKPLIETKDDYTLEKQPLIETKDHYTLEKKNKDQDPNVMTMQGTDSNSDDVNTADAVKNVDLSFEGDHQKPQLSQSDNSENKKKPIDTSILEHLAQIVTNMDSDRLRHPANIISTCNSFSLNLISFGTVVHRYFKNDSIDNTYALKRDEFNSYCEDVYKRINAIESAPLNDIDGLRSSIAIDASYELKKKIEDIIKYTQQL